LNIHGEAGYDRDISTPVPPNKRTLIKTVDLWSAVGGSAAHPKIDEQALSDVVEIIERSVTDYAPIADPADLARDELHAATPKNSDDYTAPLHARAIKPP
jgi:hypothetical protein